MLGHLLSQVCLVAVHLFQVWKERSSNLDTNLAILGLPVGAQILRQANASNASQFGPK